jgi:hypothetical protein
MFHLSRLPQASIDKLAGIMCDTVEETQAASPGSPAPETYLYLGIQRALPAFNLDDWQAVKMAMLATGRVTCAYNSFSVKVKKARKAKAKAIA